MNQNTIAAGRSSRKEKKEVATYIVLQQNVIEGKNLVVSHDLCPEDTMTLKALINNFAEGKSETLVIREEGELSTSLIGIHPLGVPKNAFEFAFKEEIEAKPSKRLQTKFRKEFFNGVKGPGEYHQIENGLKKSVYCRIVLRGNWQDETE